MLLETPGKNKKLIQEFSKANVEYPVTNSLAYSIYKLLPNDTDLTIFRKYNSTSGYNFAFIDDHYDYHSANDTWDRLDLSTLAHQGSYIMPLLTYFSKTDLSNFDSDEDYVYFSLPLFKLILYPFSWNIPLLCIGILFFIISIIVGIIKKKLELKDIGIGFLMFIISTSLAGIITFVFWKIIYSIYPQYQDIVQGFPYNGYYYIIVAILLAVTIFFKVYSFLDNPYKLASIMVAPLLCWLIICACAVFYLPGASYFITITILGIINFLIILLLKKPPIFLTLILSLPAICILTPFILSFPVALGLKILFVTGILTTLLCSLLLPVFGFYTIKENISLVLSLLGIACATLSHFQGNFDTTKPKPNSLVYLYDADSNKAFWASYDFVLDKWTKKYIKPNENKANSIKLDVIESKYNSKFSQLTRTKARYIPIPSIEVLKNNIKGNSRYLNISINPERYANRIDLFINKNFKFESLLANGVAPDDILSNDSKTYNTFTNRINNRLLTYHIRDNEALELKMQFHKDSIPVFTLYESSYDLLRNEILQVQRRPNNMMPKPFVINDAIITRKTIDINKLISL